MVERKFASIQLVGNSDSGFKFVALADDGTAWVSNAAYGDSVPGDHLKGLEASGWKQIEPLPPSDE